MAIKGLVFHYPLVSIAKEHLPCRRAVHYKRGLGVNILLFDREFRSRHAGFSQRQQHLFHDSVG